MTTAHAPAPDAAHTSRSVFARILVGVDGSSHSLDACRQAARLAERESTVEAAVVLLFTPATAIALGVPELAERLERTAASALSAAERILGSKAELRELQGLTVEALLKEAKRVHATLLAIGPPEQKRIEEIVLGGVGGELLHLAPCSMLVARPVPDEAHFPRSIIVGLDGSDEAERAYEVAKKIAARHHGTLRGAVARGGKRVNPAIIARRHPDVDVSTAAPVPALTEASTGADLLVLGSRGLHGLRALGSVSERVAHEAACSVLVVR